MSPFESIVLGLTQGITEFIPVSSSGHLEIVQNIIGDRGADFHLFLEFINIGTLLALLIFYRKRIYQILVDVFRNKNYRLALNIIITSIPAALIGFFGSKLIGSAVFFSSLITVGVAMGLIGIVMVIVDKLPKLSKLKNENVLTKPRALMIGLSQTLALIPGVSRSGSTIITGRLMGMNNESAANYSFLASIPIMCGVVLKTFLSGDDRAYFVNNLWMLLLSNLIAFVAGMIALRFVMKFLARRDALKYFGWYRIVLACLVLIVVLMQ
ncbi:MAG: undecaprenyl-diphosphate phosphatase [Candidatus Nomurabacteria bacterium]|jgi:undecaprenyl-diphosphatase|nr:undecaprenyl-diphosphate phosphatase [Candidatus Nomurabacteria bacterium]